MGRAVHGGGRPRRQHLLVARSAELRASGSRARTRPPVPSRRRRDRARCGRDPRVSAEPTAATAPAVGRAPRWYEDAVIYELHVRAFADSNGDGVGDLRGLLTKLDHVRDLGADTIWLLPFYPSPLRDDGYDTAEYKGVHPMYGTLGDFRAFMREAKRRGLRVITELVLN